ncbi:MAG TPA: Nif3-like dinuclear metal center hexameric protein [Spirochaetota bacterium]|nr:Nif3-like dinuclear metal center hexameric protein [Spirochaetota bacterium]
MVVSELFNFLNKKFPPIIQEQYDNSGKQITFSKEEISGILLALDVGDGVIIEAMNKGCNVIVTHHPLFFKPLKNIDDEDVLSKIVLNMLEKRISLYAAHTPLDKIYYDKLAEKLGVTLIDIIYRDDSNASAGSDELGYGVYGTLTQAISTESWLKQVREILNLDYITFGGEECKSIKKVALLNGAGGRKIPAITQKYDVDCIITGDVGYHEMKYAMDAGVMVVDAGHYGTEKVLLDFLLTDIQDYLTKTIQDSEVQVSIANSESNPFKVTR